jgi:hypothetical protein
MSNSANFKKKKATFTPFEHPVACLHIVNNGRAGEILAPLARITRARCALGPIAQSAFLGRLSARKPALAGFPAAALGLRVSF